jgi:hypothetical protein
MDRPRFSDIPAIGFGRIGQTILSPVLSLVKLFLRRGPDSGLLSLCVRQFRRWLEWCLWSFLLIVDTWRRRGD